jgi:hypothetical protein
MNMGRLIVNTLPDLNSVAAFVATSEGFPLSGLELKNFRVRSGVPGADGTMLRVAQVAPSPLRGLYTLDLVPVESAAPRKGLYVFDLIVERGNDRGQTVTSVVMT